MFISNPRDNILDALKELGELLEKQEEYFREHSEAIRQAAGIDKYKAPEQFPALIYTVRHERDELRKTLEAGEPLT